MSPPAARSTRSRHACRCRDSLLRQPLASNPYRVTKALGAELAGQRAGYVGIGFRVLVRIDDDQRLVTVMRMAYRADAYR